MSCVLFFLCENEKMLIRSQCVTYGERCTTDCSTHKKNNFVPQSLHRTYVQTALAVHSLEVS